MGEDGSSPPVTYKFGDTMKAFERMVAEEESDPYGGVLLEYTNPVTGGHTLPTMCARIQMLRPAANPPARTATREPCGITLCRGRGVSSVDLEDAKELDWEDHDSFWIPSWRWHQHRNRSTTEPAILFSISDSPIAEAFGMYREEKG